MIVAINYANKKYYKAQKFNSYTAIHKGKVDKVVSYSPKDIDDQFKCTNKKILSKKRGNGYWLWKPYIILKTLEAMATGDYLVYLDSGAFYIRKVDCLIQRMKLDNQEVMSFELPFKECWYTKRDTFIGMGCDCEEYTQTNQRMATMIIFRKSQLTMKFVNEWLFYAQQECIISDNKNVLGEKNYKGFRDHRHDQSIFSLLSKKYSLKAYGDPSQFGRFPDLFWGLPINEMYTKTTFPQIIAEHREKSVNKEIYIRQLIYAFAPKQVIKLYNAIYESKEKENGKKIAVLTNNRPISESCYGYGMYKVVHRLMEAMYNNIDVIICTDPNSKHEEMGARIQKKVIVRNKFHSHRSDFLSQVSFMFEVYTDIMSLRKKGVGNIFVPLGADYHELQRAYLLAKLYRMKVSIYIVDDFFSYQKYILKDAYNADALHRKITKYLKKMSNIFVISEGMQQHIYQMTKQDSCVLPIPYEYTSLSVNGNMSPPVIMFIGSINNLYIDGIRDIAEVIDKINLEKGLNIQLQFTYKSVVDVKKVIGNYRCITSKQVDGEEELRKNMRESIFCFMPYSVRKDCRIMQKTSFPSKLVEYLSSAKSIVIYGEVENTAALYFSQNDLPSVIKSRDKRVLECCILKHLKNDIDYSSMYISILRKNHSYKNIKKIFMRKTFEEC